MTSLREITDHKVNPANDQIRVVVLDPPGSGGASHVYECHLPDKEHPDDNTVVISFQNGPIAQSGINGLTHEILLAIVADRLRSFQSGEFSCRENALALTKIEEAMLWLQSRTLKRMARGVEGTHEK